MERMWVASSEKRLIQYLRRMKLRPYKVLAALYRDYERGRDVYRQLGLEQRVEFHNGMVESLDKEMCHQVYRMEDEL